MAFVKVRIPRTSQPQDLCGVDWSNPFTNGLVEVVPAYLLRTVVNSDQATTSGTMTSVVSTRGVARRSVSSGTNKDIYSGAWSRIPAPLTLLTVYRRLTNWFSTRVSGNLTSGTNGYGLAPNTTNFRAIVSRSGVNTILTGSATSSALKADALVIDATNASLFENGILTVAPTAHGGMATATGSFTHGSENGASNTDEIEYYVSYLWDRALSGTELKSLSDNPWQIFEPEEQWIWVPDDAGAPSNPTGDLAATESGSDTAALSGQIVVQGALAVTETGTDTAAIQGGASPATGTLSATESGADASAISGVIVVAGTLAATESGSDTAALSGQIVVQGALAVTETGTDTAAIQGGASPATGTLSATESGADASAISGVIVVAGTLAATESGADTALINGSSFIIATGVLAATESGADGCLASGSVLVQGLLNAAESGADTVYAPGQIYVIGSLSATETGTDTCQILQYSITAVFPAPDQVLSGIPYGPTGADYTGTAIAGAGTTIVDAISFIVTDQISMAINDTPTIMEINV